MTLQTLLIPFHGESLQLFDVDGEPFVPLKPICSRLGIAWQPQHRKLMGDKSFWKHHHMVIPSAGGEQETTCIPLRMVPTWLFSISPTKVLEENREALIVYRRECADVLWQHWSGQHKGELAILRQQVERLRAFCMAFNPMWAKITALQKAGVASWAVRFYTKRSRDETMDTIKALEDMGMVLQRDWAEHQDDEDISNEDMEEAITRASAKIEAAMNHG